MNSGALVPDDITIAMLKEELDKNPNAKGFLFDGFPRTVPQAEALDRFMKENGTAIHHVIALDVTEAEVRGRIAKDARPKTVLMMKRKSLIKELQNTLEKRSMFCPSIKNKRD